MIGTSPLATISIVTKNRRDDLRKAISSAIHQSVEVEIIVMDDASTDGTAEMVGSEFPAVKLYRSDKSVGYIAQRNRVASLASTEFIFSIDDDAVFQSPDTVAATLLEFADPRVGAVSIPHINVNHNNDIAGAAPDRETSYAGSWFRGTAYAIRKSVFQRIGGYREILFHQCEEPDYCIRMLNAGYIVRLGTAAPIHHFDSPKRDHSRQFIYAARNNMLITWYNVPLPYLPVHLGGTIVNLLVHGMRRGHPLWISWGIMRGFASLLNQFTRRRPVRRDVYRLYRRLMKQGAIPSGEVEKLLSAGNIPNDLPPALAPSRGGMGSGIDGGSTPHLR